MRPEDLLLKVPGKSEFQPFCSPQRPARNVHVQASIWRLASTILDFLVCNGPLERNEEH